MNPTVTPALTDIMTTTSVDKLFAYVLLNTLVLGAVEEMLLSSDIWEGLTAGVKFSKAKEMKFRYWI